MDLSPVEFARHTLHEPGLPSWEAEDRWFARFRYALICRPAQPVDEAVLTEIGSTLAPGRYGDLIAAKLLVESVIPGFISGEWSNEGHRILRRLPMAAKERLREIAWRRDTAHRWACAQLAGTDGAPEWAIDPDYVRVTLAERGIALA